MGSEEAASKCEYSQENSDASIVYLSSTDDDEVYSVSSEEGFELSSTSKANEIHSLLERAKPKKQIEIRIDRILGPPCSCRRKCRKKLVKNYELLIFSRFWNLGSHAQQNSYLYSCIQVRQKKKTYKKGVGAESRRAVTAFYSVDSGDGNYIDVCKVEFANLHGLQNSISRLDHIVKMKREGALAPKTNGRGKHDNRGNRHTINQNRFRNRPSIL